MGTNSASPSPLPSGLSTGKVKLFRNVSVTNIHVSLLSYHASGVTSLIPSGKGEIEKSINCNCLPNKFLHCVRVGIWKLVIRVTVHMNGLFGETIFRNWKLRDWDKIFRNRTMLLKCVFLTAYQLNCFYRAMRADCSFERSHFLITLTSSLYYLFLQIPAEQQNCTSSTWDIFKSQWVILFVSFNFCIFLLLIMKTKTLHNYHERIIISCKRI